MLTHGDWHDFTVLKCKEERKIYRDHPYGLKFYYIILPLHFTLVLHYTTLSSLAKQVDFNLTVLPLTSMDSSSYLKKAQHLPSMKMGY